MVDTDNKNEFSGDEMIDDVGGFDLININRIDRNELERQWLNLVGDSDDEEGFVAAYIYKQREFDTLRKTINLRNIHEFEERVGPVRNFDASASVLNYFQYFYTEDVFETIVNFTNLYALRK